MIRLFYNTLKSKSVDNFLLTNIFSLNPLRPAQRAGLACSSARSSSLRSDTMPARLRRFRRKDISFAFGDY